MSFFSEVLTPEQQTLIQKERDIGAIILSDKGELLTTQGTIGTDNRTEEWSKKKGVLSTGIVNDTLTVVYNADIATPEGLPDIREDGRAGEFDPEKMMTYTDVSGTYSYLEDKYKPTWVQQNVRHELRHALVAQQDELFSKEHGGKHKRLLDADILKTEHPEELRELAYLDELHSKFLDVAEGEVKGHTSFRTPESRFYSTEAEGKHPDVASSTPVGKAEAVRLFHRLQGMLLLQRMGDAGHMESENISTCVYAAGVVLATERDILAARGKIDALWEIIMKNEGINKDFTTFMASYQPTESENTPEVTPELKQILYLSN